MPTHRIFSTKEHTFACYFLFLVVKNMVVQEANKLQNRCDVLIIVTKFGTETAVVWLYLSCYMSARNYNTNCKRWNYK